MAGSYWLSPEPTELVEIHKRMADTDTICLKLRYAPEEQMARIFAYKGMEEVPRDMAISLFDAEAVDDLTARATAYLERPGVRDLLVWAGKELDAAGAS